MNRLSVRDVAQLRYFGAFENLIIVSMFALSCTGTSLLLERGLGFSASAWPGLLAFSSIFVALAMLAKVDLLSSTTAPSNKVLAIFWGMGGFAIALALHVLQPGGGSIMAWDTQRAAAAVGPAIIDAVKIAGSRLLKNDSPIPVLSVTASTLQVALAVVAAVICVLLYAPALRFVHAYWLQVNAPDWAEDYITPTAATTAGLHLQLLLPLLSSLLWVRPMFQELFGLSEAQLVLLQAAALLLIAVVMAANLRTLLQRYLDKALTGWHQLKHGSLVARAKKDDKKTLGELIRATCQATNFLLGKAAVQLLAPAAVYLGMGLLLLGSALHPGAPGSTAAEAQALLQSCVGFMAAWTGGCWFAYCGIMLWMYRTGMLQA